MPQAISWPNGARLALSIGVNVEEGSEYNPAEGDGRPDVVDEMLIGLNKPIRNFANESNYQYGLKAGAPRVMRLLEKFGVKATFTAAALALERSPDLTRQIVEGGHEVCAHGYRWIQQHQMDEAAERDFIRKAVESISQTTGERPYGWLSRYLFSANTRRLLVEQGFTYHMDDYSDDLPWWDMVGGKPILIVPYAMDTNDMKLWSAPAWSPADWLQYAIDSFDVLYEEGATAPKMMSLGVHLRVIGRPGRIRALERFFQYVDGFGDVWIATRREITDWWTETYPPEIA
jgi:peptidoglycan/xylan/chitin deacetylase (PgdA/CDA1 family)